MFFELRHRIEPLLEFVDDDGSIRQQAEVPPRLVVYVPLDRSATRHALVEVEVAGVVMMFASSEERDTTIQEKRALGELADLFRTDLGVEIDRQATVADARRALCRGLLLGELAARCEEAGSEVAELATVVIPKSKSHRQEVTGLCQTWRNRADLRDAYVRAAEAVDAEAGVAGLKLTLSKLADVETFPSIEKRLLEHVETRILSGDPTEALRVARRRKQSFWAAVELTNQLRWSLLETASDLMLTAAAVENELKSTKKDPVALIRAYSEGVGQQGEAQSTPPEVFAGHLPPAPGAAVRDFRLGCWRPARRP